MVSTTQHKKSPKEIAQGKHKTSRTPTHHIKDIGVFHLYAVIVLDVTVNNKSQLACWFVSFPYAEENPLASVISFFFFLNALLGLRLFWLGF